MYVGLENCRNCACSFGWKVAMSENKRLPLGKTFNMLGAVIDLSRSMEGVVQISNKPSRIE